MEDFVFFRDNISESDISGVEISSNAVPCHILIFGNSGFRF